MRIVGSHDIRRFISAEIHEKSMGNLEVVSLLEVGLLKMCIFTPIPKQASVRMRYQSFSVCFCNLRLGSCKEPEFRAFEVFVAILKMYKKNIAERVL